MKQTQVDLMDELEVVMKPIIKRYIEEKILDLADVVYCSGSTAEKIALQTKREMRRSKTIEE